MSAPDTAENGERRLHTSACPMVLTPCTCDDPEQPYVLIPQRLLSHLLDEADPATIQTLHDEIADYLTHRKGAGYTRVTPPAEGERGAR